VLNVIGDIDVWRMQVELGKPFATLPTVGLTKEGLMPQFDESLIIQCDHATTAESLRATIVTETGSEPSVLKRQNLAGDPVTWMVVAATAISTLPHILDAIGRLLEKMKVRSIKIGKVEIQNPTPTDVREMRRRLTSADLSET
jgi:type II secretory pathway predicted ATPase ExeA